eukprot:COSAG01_NODE_27861_length_675_cov_0.798611_1_plen_58_part_01
MSADWPPTLRTWAFTALISCGGFLLCLTSSSAACDGNQHPQGRVRREHPHTDPPNWRP